MHAAHLEGLVEGVKEKGDAPGRGAYDTTGAPTSGPDTAVEAPGGYRLAQRRTVTI